jgi:hypothetical protein
MLDDNNEVLLRLDREQKVYELFLSYGCDETRALVASKAVAGSFDWSGARLSFKQADGTLVSALEPSVREELGVRYDFLFPVNAQDQLDGIAKCLLGVNMSDRSRAVSKHGIETMNKHARAYGLQNIWERRAGKAPNVVNSETAKGDPSSGKPAAGEKRSNNPWRAENWSPEEQGRLIRSLGTRACADLARAAGCKSITSGKPSEAA